MSRLEKLTNVVVLVVALSAGTILAHDRLKAIHEAPHQLPTNASPLVGTRIQLAGVNWKQHDRTLVLAISTQCHFCTASTSFYKSLATQVALHKSDALIAVLPQDAATAGAFLASHNIAPAQIISLDLSELGVTGTPTLLLVNRDGLVTESWVGKLPSALENQVISQL